MAWNTKSNQKINIKNSQDYIDTLDVRGAESTSTNLEDDLNMIRSSIKEITGESKWYNEPISDIRKIAAQTGTTKLVLYHVSEYEPVSIPIDKNFVALSNISIIPSEAKAIESNTEGAVVSLLTGASGVMHSLSTAPNDGNLVLIRNANTNSGIVDINGRQIFGLLQVDSDATDGIGFDLYGDESAQISFVARDPTTELFYPADIVSIGGRTIEYAYTIRKKLFNASENFINSCKNFIEPLISSNTITSNFIEEVLVIDFDGKTSFSLSKVPMAGGDSILFINGIAYSSSFYEISGSTLTWLNIEFELEVSDNMMLKYEAN